MPERPRADLALGGLAHQVDRLRDALAVEGGELELALAQVLVLVEQQHRVRADERAEDRVALAGVEDLRRAGEDGLDVGRVGEDDEVPGVGDLVAQREDVAVTPAHRRHPPRSREPLQRGLHRLRQRRTGRHGGRCARPAAHAPIVLARPRAPRGWGRRCWTAGRCPAPSSSPAWPDCSAPRSARQALAAGWAVGGTVLRRPCPVAGARAQRVDVRDGAAVRAAVARARPAAVVHTAYRQSGDGARETIVDGSAHAAGAARAAGARLVHLSTDLVFSGRLGRPLTEDDEPDPVGA